MYENEKVDEDDAKKLASDLNAIFQKTSAKESTGVEDLFVKIGKKFLNPNSDEGGAKNEQRNNKKKLNNNYMENIPETSRLKKEREKMKGHKCELCQKFYECVNESEDFLCQECSRHRTDQPINKTPQGFYDLNI